ncbi:MAG: NAD(P)-dependent oxidoreductase, partial [Oscillospiraceae bacterium]|nr:NAD(P)-dependent oxidoreductase [Oscillospiraceae bacterium]
PVNTPIPDMIQHFLNGQLDEAGQMLFDNNPLSMVCSLVCDHEKQCEGHCVLGKKGAPVHISSIENYISDTYFDKMQLKVEQNKHKKVAIIGTGPAGITISVILSQRGYDVTLFESRDRIGGVLRYGIPEFRLPKSILDRYKQKLIALGIKIRPNTSIGGALTIDDLFRDGYKAVFIGTGVWRPQTLGVKGESLGNVHYAIDYLVNPDVYALGNDVAVIGAGNAAMDVARTALRKGARNVTVFARGMQAAASAREVDYAIADGVVFKYGMYIQEITEDGPVFKKAIYNADGEICGFEEPHTHLASATIISISQGPKDKIVTTTSGLQTNEKGLLQTTENGETTRAGIFASGDVVKGARTVVEAVKYSKQVAQAMDEYLQTLD